MLLGRLYLNIFEVKLIMNDIDICKCCNYNVSGLIMYVPVSLTQHIVKIFLSSGTSRPGGMFPELLENLSARKYCGEQKAFTKSRGFGFGP